MFIIPAQFYVLINIQIIAYLRYIKVKSLFQAARIEKRNLDNLQSLCTIFSKISKARGTLFNIFKQVIEFFEYSGSEYSVGATI